MDSLQHWHKEFWELLTFGMQMSLILVTGYALAEAPALKRGIQLLSNLPQNTADAACLTVAVTCGFAFLHLGPRSNCRCLVGGRDGAEFYPAEIALSLSPFWRGFTCFPSKFRVPGDKLIGALFIFLLPCLLPLKTRTLYRKSEGLWTELLLRNMCGMMQAL